MYSDTENIRACILVVEDDPSIQFLLKYNLRRHYDVEMTSSVDAALEAASHRPFDLFLIDINLGEPRTGLDLLGLLREMPAHQTTAAVACSAYITPANTHHFLEQGFVACVAKPFTGEGLLSTINTVLGEGVAHRRAA